MANETGTKKMQEDLIEVKDNIVEKTEESVGNFKEKVSGNLATAADKIHEKSDTAQDYLMETADKINEFAHQKIEKANTIGHRAAEALDTSSDYVRNFDLAEQKELIKEKIRQKPELSLVIAGVIGLFFGVLIGRTSR